MSRRDTSAVSGLQAKPHRAQKQSPMEHSEGLDCRRTLWKTPGAWTSCIGIPQESVSFGHFAETKRSDMAKAAKENAGFAGPACFRTSHSIPGGGARKLGLIKAQSHVACIRLVLISTKRGSRAKPDQTFSGGAALGAHCRAQAAQKRTHERTHAFTRISCHRLRAGHHAPVAGGSGAVPEFLHRTIHLHPLKLGAENSKLISQEHHLPNLELPLARCTSDDNGSHAPKTSLANQSRSLNDFGN